MLQMLYLPSVVCAWVLTVPENISL